MKDTFTPSQKFIKKKWLIVDATEKKLGRVATQISEILMGKLKSYYTPYLDIGDNIIVINAEKIIVTGNKETQKNYYNHSGRPGGLRVENLKFLRQRKPEKILEEAIKGMLPKGSLGRQIYTNLKVYKGNEHPHIAQRPELFKLK
jgi:large subunit ribosomal protein L13